MAASEAVAMEVEGAVRAAEAWAAVRMAEEVAVEARPRAPLVGKKVTAA